MDNQPVGARFWLPAEAGGWQDDWSWDDVKIRQKCIAGTKREWNAYINAGYISKTMNNIRVGVEDLFDIFSNHPDKASLTCREVALSVAKKHSITIEDLQGSCRRKELVAARKEFCRICALSIGKSYTTIARFLKRDHTTVMHHLGLKRR